MVEIDMVNRDPNDINDHLQVRFEDVIAEPPGAHSINCVWKCSYKCFTCCKNCCYKLLTLFCAIPLSIYWGCEFAVIAFQHVWCITPYMRTFMIECGCYRKFFGTCLQCFLQPCFEACSFCFSNIRVTNMNG